MANSLGRSLTGCVVLIRADVLKPEYADPETRKFRVQGGFGAVDFTSGTQMYGTWVATGEEDSVRGYHVEAVIEEAESAEMNKVYMDPTTNEWVGEYETRDGDEISRQTEWFATEAEARRFTRTGERHVIDGKEGSPCSHQEAELEAQATCWIEWADGSARWTLSPEKLDEVLASTERVLGPPDTIA